MESKFEKDAMLYFRNIVNKMINISEKVNSLHKRIDVLESVLMDGFRATGTAFSQTKEVCQAIVNETRSVKSNLEEYGGIIEGSSYFDTRVV
jgi:hypothetical protein